MPNNAPLIQNDVVVMGLLASLLALIFVSAASKNRYLRSFYKYVPSLLLCYFLPGLLNSAGVISGESSGLYEVTSNYLLPASLVLFTISLDLKEIWKMRKKAGVMFIAAASSIVIGGPLALSLVSLFAPDVLGGEGADAAWRGLSTVAGSWIGGGANQAALYRVFQPSPGLFSASITVDVIVANIWMAFLLFGAGITNRINKYLKADTSEIDALKVKMETYRLAGMRIPTLSDTMAIVGTGLGVTGLSHLLGVYAAGWIGTNAPALEKYSLTSSFFWVVLLATAFGILLSFTRARKLEDVGASRIGSVFLYILVATIGMKMDILSIFSQPMLIAVGLTWIFIHAVVILVVAKLTRSPFFFVAVGSQACIGGAASAPIVASAFHTALAPVGVLLAIFGYAVGTYGGYICGLLMQWVSS